MNTTEHKIITAKVTKENIEVIKKIEEEFDSHRSFSDFIGDSIGGAASNIIFVLVHVVWITSWIVINTHNFPNIKPFDAYPFYLLSFIITIESVFLFMFVLMKQTRMNRRAEQRSHLNLQLALLVEQELTKVLQIIEKVNQNTGATEVVDTQTKELSKETDVETLAEKLGEAFPQK